MSIDKLIADHTAALAANTAAVEKNTEHLARVIAGQEAAMAKLEGGAARPKRESAAEKKAREAAEALAGSSTTDQGGSTQSAAPEEPAGPDIHPLLVGAKHVTAKVVNPKTNAEEDTPTADYRAGDFSRDEVKNEFIGWLGETTDPEVRKERAQFVAAIGQHFGVKLPFHPTEGLTDDEQRKQTLFFLRRKREGLKVDFGAEYDFDGDPLADQSVEGEPATDDFDALG